jgi:hypothetical protein
MKLSRRELFAGIAGLVAVTVLSEVPAVAAPSAFIRQLNPLDYPDFRTWIEPPAINEVRLMRLGPGRVWKAEKTLRNEASVSDKRSPHYLGREQVHLLLADDTISDEKGVEIVERTFQECAYASQRVKFTSSEELPERVTMDARIWRSVRREKTYRGWEHEYQHVYS